MGEPTREGALMQLMFVNREGLVGDVMVRGSLGHSNHKIIELLILGKVRREISRTVTLADCDLFRSLVDRLPWKAVLKSKLV